MIESNQAYTSPVAVPGYDVSAQIGDLRLDDAAIDRIEVVRARYALELFRSRLSDDRVRELLAPDIAAANERARGWLAASQGRWRPAITKLSVTGIGAQAFADWFIGRVKGADEEGMRAGHPEHFLTHPRGQAPVEVIETVGQDQGPWRIFLKFIEHVSEIPIEPVAIYPIKLAAIITDDSATTIGHALHEFRDIDGGFEARLVLNFPAAVPDDIISGHQHHFAIEFRNWSRNAAAAQHAKR